MKYCYTNRNFQYSVFIVLLSFCLVFSGTAQNNKHWCASDIIRNKAFNENPALKHKNDSIENVLLLFQQQQFQTINSTKSLTNSQQLYTIPVVVHIVHNNGAENIADAQVLQGIQDLNNAFRNVGAYDPSTGVDVEIEFCLAQQDENGDFSTGINRVVSTFTNMTVETDDMSLKNLIRWNPHKYMNIWLVKEITSSVMGPGVAGYALFPSVHGQPKDGLVVEANTFGSSIDNSKVAVHEVGHYLGLYHTFEGACINNNCQTDGDKVCDTPPDASSAPVYCGGTVNTCQTDDDDISTNNPFRPVSNGGLGDQNDMFINYMDYGYQACQSAFTQGQKNRMVPALTDVRGSLLLSHGCLPPCLNTITASFTSSDTLVIAGTAVTFTNTSINATNYTWQINGTTFSSSTSPSFTFSTQGTYIIKLIASNDNISCTKEHLVTIVVTCPVTASYTASTTSVLPGDSVIFTNTSIGANSYQWIIDGAIQATTINFTNTFPIAGGFTVTLVASNGICSSTFNVNITAGTTCVGKQGNIWYFGSHAGLDFSSGTPVALTDGAIDTNEGCAVISSDAGSLLFYTDGSTVWNKNHNAMPNGTGLIGNTSTTQSALIVPKPGNTNIYYVFTADYQGYPWGLEYSEVDMTLNGGLGDVTATKNIMLHTSVTEKIMAVKKANNVDFWVISHDFSTDTFLAYSLTSSGVNTSPVTSNAGHIDVGNFIHGFGYLKSSPDGNKLVQAVEVDSLVDVLNFNRATGIVTPDFSITSPIQDPYGIEFSADGTRLYIGDNTTGIYQYDMTLGNSAAIIASATHIASYARALQMGPDGKIYVAPDYGINYIACINNPSALGVSCNYDSNAVSLQSGLIRLGLPNFMQNSFYDNNLIIVGPDTVCAQNVTYTLNSTGLSAITWSFHGNGSITNSTDSTCAVSFNNIGADTLIVSGTGNCGLQKDTLFITSALSSTINLGLDTTLCLGDSIFLNAGDGFISYHWQDASTNQTYVVTTPGQYNVTATKNGGCIATDSIKINQARQGNTLNLGSDIISCNGGVTVLKAGSGFESYRWQDGSTDSSYTVCFPGKYWVTVSSCGNVVTDTITVLWQSNLPFTIAQDGKFCGGQHVFLKSNPATLASYIWEDGSTNFTREIQTPGKYSLIVTDISGCYNEDTVDVPESDCHCVLVVPTAFTPNGDGYNDFFILQGFENCVSDFSLVIYDRWGEKIFETNNLNYNWDGSYKGKSMNSAVFVYNLNAELFTGEKISKKGNISLIR